VNRIQKLALLSVCLCVPVFAQGAHSNHPGGTNYAPEIDLASGAGALVLLTGAVIWIRGRRKR
jgi:hypothetical protein